MTSGLMICCLSFVNNEAAAFTSLIAAIDVYVYNLFLGFVLMPQYTSVVLYGHTACTFKWPCECT